MSNSIEAAIAACIFAMETVETEEGALQVSASARFPASFIGFAGHFPDAPVLPAIVQLAAVRLLAERALRIRLESQGFSRTKFRGMVQPEEEIFLQLKIESPFPGRQGRFKITGVAGEALSSGSFTFREVSG